MQRFRDLGISLFVHRCNMNWFNKRHFVLARVLCLRKGCFRNTCMNALERWCKQHNLNNCHEHFLTIIKMICGFHYKPVTNAPAVNMKRRWRDMSHVSTNCTSNDVIRSEVNLKGLNAKATEFIVGWCGLKWAKVNLRWSEVMNWAEREWGERRRMSGA